jgi:hypothetical protein
MPAGGAYKAVMTGPSKTFRESRPLAPAPKPRRSDAPLPPVAPDAPAARPSQPDEIGGPTGPEPTRYGDWERNGRCTDF